MTRGARAVAAAAVMVTLMAVAVAAVRASYGALAGGYTVTGSFGRATYGFGPNTEIDYLGVQVGHVTHVRLAADHRVRASMKIDAGFRLPVGTTADVHDRSLFGDPYIALDLPAATPARYLRGGDTIDVTSVDADTSDLIATTAPLLSRINGPDLLSLLTELDQATRGEGPKLAQAIHDGAQLTDLYASTIGAQLKALDAFSAFQTAVTPDAADLNTLAAQSNATLPTLNAAEAAFEQALETVRPFADKLAAIIVQERPNIDRLLAGGDNVIRLLAMRQPQVEQAVSGLAAYLQKFSQRSGPETLPDGTKFIYFKSFIELGDIQQLICGLVDPPQGGSAVPPPLQPLVAALSGTALGCQAPAPTPAATGPAAAPPPGPTGSGLPGSGLPPAAGAAAGDLMQRIAGQVGAPEPPQTETVGQLIQTILGAGR